MVIHNFRIVDETRYMLLVMAEKRVGKPQKLKTDLAITIQPLTLRWREAESLYKTVIKLEVKVNNGPDLVHRPQGERFNPQYMSVYLQTQWSCVCPLLGLDLPRRGWNSPSYRGSPGRPALWAHFGERNGAFCMDALSRIFNPFTHSSIHDSSSSLRNTYHSQRTDIRATGGIRTHNLSRRGAVDHPATATGEISHLLIENEK